MEAKEPIQERMFFEYKNKIRETGIEPEGFIIHPKLAYDLIGESTKTVYLPNYNNLKFMGKKIYRSEDIGEEDIKCF